MRFGINLLLPWHRSSSLLLLLLSIFPALSLSARQNYNVDEMRLELSDVKHDLHSARIEISLLEEKVAKQQRLIASFKTEQKIENAGSLEKKVADLEKLLNKALTDVRLLYTQTSKALSRMQELEGALALQDKKFEEISKLKGTLTSLSKVMGQESKTSPSERYSVKPGDSLEKIARKQHTSVKALKELNHLTQDKIVVGQELKIE
jgi:LysM repeat protein